VAHRSFSRLDELTRRGVETHQVQNGISHHAPWRDTCCTTFAAYTSLVFAALGHRSSSTDSPLSRPPSDPDPGAQPQVGLELIPTSSMNTSPARRTIQLRRACRVVEKERLGRLAILSRYEKKIKSTAPRHSDMFRRLRASVLVHTTQGRGGMKTNAWGSSGSNGNFRKPRFQAHENRAIGIS
jgi:hypothetical protein